MVLLYIHKSHDNNSNHYAFQLMMRRVMQVSNVYHISVQHSIEAALYLKDSVGPLSLPSAV